MNPLSWFRRRPVPSPDAVVLARLAVESRTRSPWDAAVSVFGGAAVTRDAVGTGLCGSVAASTSAPGVRGCREP